MIKIYKDIFIDESEINLQFIRSSGPGGQNVNKVATAAQLRFPLQTTSYLPEVVRQRAMKLAGKQLTKEGEIVITGKKHRTQQRNRQDVIKRLCGLLTRAAIPPKLRKPTKTPKKVKQARLADKRRRATVKKSRQSPSID